ncbi:hypothetical protein E3Q13_01073 [Wallemia mellicola]|nr:hypothetical protein E3Q13_01073 [Wallemia mellicola]
MGFVKNLTHTLLYSPDNLDSFSLQYWSEQKVVNAAIVIDIVRIIAGLGNRQGNLSILQSGLTQCLIDLSLSSNAPVTLKAQTLTALTAIFSTSPQNQQFFTQSQTQPILNSDAYAAGYLRLPPRLATISLIDIALNGESGDENRMVDDVDSLKGHNLMFQVAALSAFESLITSNDSLKLEIIARSLLLEALSNLPTPEVSLDGAFDSQKVFFASLVLSHVLRYSEDARAMARNIPFNPSEDTDEDETVSLLHGIFGNLITCSRERAAADARLREKEFSSINRTEEPEKQGNQENEEEVVKQIDIDWTRLTVSYLILLSVWVWDSPATVSDILKESSNLQVLIQPIKQSSGVDALIQGLCAFTFGAIYKFNTGPSEVSKKDLHSIIEKQIGVDNIIQSLARFRSDKRFCKIGSPDDALAYAETPQEDGWWFDWNYVEFFKGSFMAVQRSVISEEIEETTKVAPPLPQASSPLPESTDNTDHEKVVQEKDSQIETHKQRIEELKVKNANMEMEMERVNNELGEAKSKLQALWEQGSPEVAGLRGDLAEGVKREETLRAELDKLNNELETLKQKEGEHKSASGELTTKIEILENEVKSNKEEVLRLKEQNDGLKSTNERDTNEIQSTKNTNETLQKENEHLKTQLEKHIESEKEHEDLLILLEDMSTKRSNDKNRMKQAGLELGLKTTMSDNLEKNSLETDLEKRGADKTDVNAGDVSAVEIDAFEQNKESSDYQEFRTLGWWQAETLALGVLSFPKLASEIGVGPTIIATIGLAFLAWVTGYILVDFKVNHPSVMSFADAGQVIAASHVNSGGTALSEMSSNARCSVLLGFCMALLGFVFTIPRKYEHTAYASFASCVSIFTACLITIIACGVTRDSWGDSNGEVTWKAFNNPGLAGVINSFTEIVFAYGGHAFIFNKEMKNPNDFKKSLAVVQIISTAFYITIGVGVYILVGDANVVSPALSIPSHKIETIAYAIAMISIIVAGVIPALNGLKQLWLELFRGKPMLTSNSWKANALWIFMAFITWMLAFCQ